MVERMKDVALVLSDMFRILGCVCTSPLSHTLFMDKRIADRSQFCEFLELANGRVLYLPDSFPAYSHHVANLCECMVADFGR